MASNDEQQRESPGTGEPMVERLASALDVPAKLVTEWASPRSEAEQRPFLFHQHETPDTDRVEVAALTIEATPEDMRDAITAAVAASDLDELARIGRELVDALDVTAGRLDESYGRIAALTEYGAPISAGPDVRAWLGSINNALCNGSHMNNASLAMTELCARLGVDRETLTFDPVWARTAAPRPAGITLPPAWHNDPTIKDVALTRVRRHIANGRLIRGYDFHTTPDGPWRGGMLACLVADALAAEQGVSVSDVAPDPGVGVVGHADRLFGIAVPLGTLLDDLYELLPDPPVELAVTLLDAIGVGTPPGDVLDRLMRDILTDPHHGLARLVPDQGRSTFDAVASLYRRQLSGDAPSLLEWSDAASNVHRSADTVNSCLAPSALHAAFYAAAYRSSLLAVDGAVTPAESLASAAACVKAVAAHASRLAAGQADGEVAWWRWLHGRLLTHLADTDPGATP